MGGGHGYVHSPTLVRKYNTNGSDPFACVDGSAQEDWFYGAFDGKRIKLTAETAEEGIGRELGRRYGTTAQASMKVPCLARGKRRATSEFVAMRWCRTVSRRAWPIGEPEPSGRVGRRTEHPRAVVTLRGRLGIVAA